MIGVCLNLFDDRTVLNKKLKDIAAGHFLKGVSSNQYYTLTQAVLAALSTCIGKDDTSICSWKRIFSFFLSVMVPHARYLEEMHCISNTMKLICSAFGRAKVKDSSKAQNDGDTNLNEPSFTCRENSNEKKKETFIPMTSCPYHGTDLVSRSSLYKSKYSTNSVDADLTAAQRKVRLNSLLQDKDTREDEPANNDPFVLHNHE